GNLRVVVAVVALVTFSLTATDTSFLLSRSWAKVEDSGGPLHIGKCCCPKLCKTPPQSAPSCHKSAGQIEKLNSAATAPGAVCVLKGGCGKAEPVLGFHTLLKEFVPEPPEQIGFDPSLCIFGGTQISFLLLDSSIGFFHPPRNS